MSSFDHYVIEAGEIPWPSELPSCYLQAGFAYSPVKATVNHTMGAGLGKQRRRFTKAPWLLQGILVLTSSQRFLLDAFIKDTLDNGALTFLKPDPILSQRLYGWRFEEPLAYAPRHGGTWQVMIKLSRLPLRVEHLEHSLIDKVGNHLTSRKLRRLGE